MRLRDIVIAVFVLVIGLALIAGVGLGAVAVVRTVWHAFLALPKEVAVAIVAASATVFASALAVVAGQYLQRRATIVQDLRKANAPMYAQWVALWFRILTAEQAGLEQPTQQEVVRELAGLSEQLMLWGSDRVLREWVSLRLAFVESPTDEDGTPTEQAGIQNLVGFARLMRAMRRDMGHRNWRVDDTTVLGLFVNDAKDAVAKAKAQAN